MILPVDVTETLVNATIITPEQLMSSALIENTTIEGIQQDYFNYCGLNKCYINVCEHLFTSQTVGGKCGDKDKNTYTSNRDMVWMALNTISYMVSFGQYAEALRILTIITDCNGLCNSDMFMRKGSTCGCA